FSYYYRHNSPRRIAGVLDEITKVEAIDKHTVAFHLSKYMADWPYRIGYGHNSSIMPKEVADAGATEWKNATGTGPFMLENYVSGNSHTYA
ncbi:ABC transporter substrate-binding protein, partial [Enterobacter kobei]|uniref:ABC transporter substrate-binding protein n=1 Tax=Enterobacter kobei TaxID=208224 RepID=UPI001EF7EEF8